VRCEHLDPAVGETKLGTKVELKNLNSISFVRDGIAHEIKRQIAIVTAGGRSCRRPANTTARLASRRRCVRRKWRTTTVISRTRPDAVKVDELEGPPAGGVPGAAIRQAAAFF